ncbi:hypothetical protein GQ600_6669 [Phytophthora cactorum]|nr:hypothetical protein GQ600_6669 [Phytophthora cactorum]
MDVNYARMEVQGQPWGGWSVDLDSCWCPCNCWYACGVCVHILYALGLSVTLTGVFWSIATNASESALLKILSRRPSHIGQR